jgi:asparagine synthase (glutamine-hydrolysing)
MNILKEQIKYHDSPVATINSLLNYTLYEKIKKDGFKVSITGIGSDEIFSGYYDHHLLYLNEIKNMKNLYEQSCNNWKQIVNPIVRNPFLKKMKLYINNPRFRKHIYQFDNFKKNLFLNNKSPNFTEKNYSKSLMKNRMANEMFNEIVPVVLKEEDLNAMCHSIENRSPYLDSNLFKSAFNMPPAYYIKNGLAKWPLRQLIKNFVPEKIRMNKIKTGFNASIKDILKFNNENIDFLMGDSEIFDIIKRKKFLELIKNNKQLSGVENNFIFNFLSVKLFLEN